MTRPTSLGADAQKYAGKRWGELPGELRTLDEVGFLDYDWSVNSS